MKRFLLFLSGCMLLVACAEKVIEPPADLLTEEQMGDIIYDLAVLNATKATNKAVMENNNLQIMPFIYEKYGIDSVRFAHSDQYYASIPLKYQMIYESVERRLQAQIKVIEDERKEKAEKSRASADKRRDSLKNVDKPVIRDNGPDK
ncbi:MAG: DUF4296 domain-containing protein [Flavobacteriaceae bacterium]|nr:DUF4296 domain-containing protein [Flavobacteriaceae bacterium]